MLISKLRQIAKVNNRKNNIYNPSKHATDRVYKASKQATSL